MLVYVRSAPRRRRPRPLSFSWLLGTAVGASVPAYPFWLVWHPLGYAVAAVVFVVLAAALLVREAEDPRGRRVGASAEASARVRSRRG